MPIFSNIKILHDKSLINACMWLSGCYFALGIGRIQLTLLFSCLAMAFSSIVAKGTPGLLNFKHNKVIPSGKSNNGFTSKIIPNTSRHFN